MKACNLCVLSLCTCPGDVGVDSFYITFLLYIN